MPDPMKGAKVCAGLPPQPNQWLNLHPRPPLLEVHHAAVTSRIQNLPKRKLGTRMLRTGLLALLSEARMLLVHQKGY